MTPEERAAMREEVLAAFDQEAKKYKDFEDSSRRIRNIREAIDKLLKGDNSHGRD